jgi:hypothetical protein
MRNISEPIRTCHLPPSTKRHQLFGGKGEGNPCSACGEPITAQQVQYDVDFGTQAAPLVLHLRCYQKWVSDAAGTTVAGH